MIAEERRGREVYKSLSENWSEAEQLLREHGII